MSKIECPIHKVLPCPTIRDVGITGLVRVGLSGLGLVRKALPDVIDALMKGDLGVGDYPGFLRKKIGRILTHPNLVQMILENAKQFKRNTPADRKLALVIGGPFTEQPDSEAARKSRRLAFSSLDLRDPVFQKLIDLQAAHFVDALLAAGQDPINVAELSGTMAYQVIAKRMLGDTSESTTQLEPLWARLNTVITPWIMNPSASDEVLPDNVADVVDEIEDILAAPIAQAREEHGGIPTKSALKKLVDAGCDDNYVQRYLRGMLFAGHITTATAITWLLYNIDGDPAIKAKIYQELSGLKSLPVSVSDFKKLIPYTYAAMCESLRLYPVVPLVGRGIAISADEVIAGVVFRPGDMVQGWLSSLHRNPSIWGSDVDKFIPDRFMEDLSEVQEAAYMPFGYGPTQCVGKVLALTEMLAVLRKLAQSNVSLERTCIVKVDTKPSLVMLPEANRCMMKVAQYNSAIA
jgi:cytochrome P450